MLKQKKGRRGSARYTHQVTCNPSSTQPYIHARTRCMWRDCARLHGHGLEPFFLALARAWQPSIVPAQRIPREPRGRGCREREQRPTWSPQDGWHDRARLHGHGFEPFFLALVHASCPSIIRAQDSPRGQLSSHPALHSMTRRGRAGSVMEGRRDLPIGDRNSRPTASSLSMRGEPSACGAMPRTR